MKRIFIIYTAVIAVAMTAASCSVEKDVLDTDKAETPVSVHLSKASGSAAAAAAGDSEYAIRFWTGGIRDSWGMSLDSNDDPLAAGNVDYYKYDGGQNLLVMGPDGKAAVYPYDGSSVYAMGYYPASALVSSVTDGMEDWQVLTIKAPQGESLPKPGLVDVCVTDIESGSESDMFTSSIDNELQFRHTQVKLNFQYKRSTNLNGRVAEIWVTIPQALVANRWDFTEERKGVGTYVAKTDYTEDEAKGSMIFSSTEDWYQEVGGRVYDMYYSYVINPDSPTFYTVTSFNDCYVMPSETMFGPVDIEVNGEMMAVQHIKFRLDAVIISSDINIPNKRIKENVCIPLRKKDGSGAMWTETVKAGDAFNILIGIEQNRLALYAEKGTWDKGGYLTIPLNPLN